MSDQSPQLSPGSALGSSEVLCKNKLEEEGEGKWRVVVQEEQVWISWKISWHLLHNHVQTLYPTDLDMRVADMYICMSISLMILKKNQTLKHVWTIELYTNRDETFLKDFFQTHWCIVIFSMIFLSPFFFPTMFSIPLYFLYSLSMLTPIPGITKPLYLGKRKPA